MSDNSHARRIAEQLAMAENDEEDDEDEDEEEEDLVRALNTQFLQEIWLTDVVANLSDDAHEGTHLHPRPRCINAL